MPVDASDSASPAVELANPSDATDRALAGTMEPVRISIQYGSHPGGSLHSDGIIICAWAVVGGRRRVENERIINVARERKLRANRKRLKIAQAVV